VRTVISVKKTNTKSNTMMYEKEFSFYVRMFVTQHIHVLVMLEQMTGANPVHKSKSYSQVILKCRLHRCITILLTFLQHTVSYGNKKRFYFACHQIR
jgi:hypothetical protein